MLQLNSHAKGFTNPKINDTSKSVLNQNQGVSWRDRFIPSGMYFSWSLLKKSPLRNTLQWVSHITASQAPENTLTWKTVHENSSCCDSWSASGSFNFTFWASQIRGAGILQGLGMGIVSSVFAGHCNELTARPTKAYPRPLPGGSPIKMCRNAGRKTTELDPNIKITARLLGPCSCSLRSSRSCLFNNRGQQP